MQGYQTVEDSPRNPHIYWSWPLAALIIGYGLYRVGYFVYCAERTYAVNECMESDRHTTCERWESNCASYDVVLILQVGKDAYRAEEVDFNSEGSMVGQSHTTTFKKSWQKIYHPVQCPQEMELYREDF